MSNIFAATMRVHLLVLLSSRDEYDDTSHAMFRLRGQQRYKDGGKDLASYANCYMKPVGVQRRLPKIFRFVCQSLMLPALWTCHSVIMGPLAVSSDEASRYFWCANEPKGPLVKPDDRVTLVLQRPKHLRNP